MLNYFPLFFVGSYKGNTYICIVRLQKNIASMFQDADATLRLAHRKL